jgi:hypothetical protein
MSRINVGRVILGGLVAGVVINIAETILNLAVVAQSMEDALPARNLPPVGGAAIGGSGLETFIGGIVTVWLYAAIRPRFGAGAGTAVIAAAVVWFFAYLHQSFALVLMGVFPAKVMVVGTVWGLAEVVVASIVGAWVYKE